MVRTEVTTNHERKPEQNGNLDDPSGNTQTNILNHVDAKRNKTQAPSTQTWVRMSGARGVQTQKNGTPPRTNPDFHDFWP